MAASIQITDLFGVEGLVAVITGGGTGESARDYNLTRTTVSWEC